VDHLLLLVLRVDAHPGSSFHPNLLRVNIANVGVVPKPVKTRPYSSQVRRHQAESTRRAVLAAARRLFQSRGYAATAVADVAAAAKVSVDTVYASVGRKPALLLAVIDMILGSSDEDLPSEQRDYVLAIRAAGTAEEKIAVYAAALGRLIPQTAPLQAALAQAARTEPECARVWQQLKDRRAANMRLFAADLRGTGRVREDLDDDAVADIVWVCNSVEYFTLLGERGWSAERYAEHLRDLWERVLLAER
jgi:AcrR family transcriptional regulator